MPARRDSVNRAAVSIVRDYEVGAMGLSFADVPPDVAAAPDAAAEWARLAEEYRAAPTRFREGDRSAVTAYCVAFAVFVLAARQLLADGLITADRSSADRGRQVKSPSLAVWTQASAQLRYWSRELGLTPDSRGRMGLVNDGKEDPDDDIFNPFA